MNSILAIRDSFVSKIVDTIAAYDLTNGTNGFSVFENDKAFDGSQFDYFLWCSINHSVNQQLGKNFNPELDEGFYQVTINVPSKDGKYDRLQQGINDFIRQQFKQPFSGITITEMTSNSGRTIEGYYVRDLTLNWQVIGE